MARVDSTRSRSIVAWVIGITSIFGAVSLEASRYGDAFPGAEGFGSKAVGGRGGKVLIVDSLEDKVRRPPAGTLRWALQQKGPRIVVFRVAGTIELRGKIYIRRPFITVAGQTAPGDGITLKDFPLVVETRDVILQGLRVRLGGETLPNSDAFNIQGPRARNIMVDHCSFSWSTDEVVATNGGAHGITFQNSIIAEGLECSIHPEGCHSRGLLLRDGSRNITVQRNYFAHNDFRNPKMLGDPDELGGRRATFDFYNNVVYDWGDWAVAGAGVAKINVERNFFKMGPSTLRSPESREIRSTEESAGYKLFAEGNIGPSCPNGCVDEWAMVRGTDDKFRASKRNRSTPRENVLSAKEARDSVTATAGASYRLDDLGRRIERRDAVDARLIRQFWAGTGGLVDSPHEVGGWPLLDLGLPVVDSDRDGMPDAWERAHDLDPFDSSDARGNPDQDLYTNIEEFLFEGDPRRSDG